MATYLELANIRLDPRYTEWAQRVEQAILKSANNIADQPAPTEGKRDWAVRALQDPGAQLRGFENFVILENNDATIDQILTATDSLIQTNVDKAVDALVPDTLGSASI